MVERKMISKITKHNREFQLILRHYPEIERYVGNDDGFLFTNTREFSRFTRWAMDDSPYIATIDKVFEMYDEEYEKSGTVWICENYLKYKYEQQIAVRYDLPKTLFENHNILGKHTGSNIDYKKSLEKREIW